jgi:predicted ATPase
MLTELRFENFKSWRDTGVMRMAPLTGFFGTNSSGKTAILQFLLMLKQTVESNDQSQILNFGNEHSYVDLGTINAFIHRHELPAQMRFRLSWRQNPYLSAPQVPVGEYVDDRLELKIPIFGSVDQLTFSATIQFERDAIGLGEFSYSYLTKASQTSKVTVVRQNNGYRLKSKGVIQSVNPPIRKMTESVKAYGFPSSVRSEGTSEVSWRGLQTAFEQGFQHLYYLGPIRDYPKRFYSWSGEKPQDVGRRGENTIAALLTARKQDPEIEIKIAHWLKEMGLIDDFKVDLIAPEQRLYQASVRIAPGGTYCPITDVGFGVSQILPVLVLCYYVPKGSTIIFEQPEIHLHPSAQQKLADVFIDVIKHRELQIIIESHSEHLLHRLQRRIAETELALDQAALYFCQMENDGASSLTSLELDEFGNITNWPEDFFGNEMEDLVAMTEAAMQRSMDTEAA